jgi:hypothetical protein
MTLPENGRRLRMSYAYTVEARGKRERDLQRMRERWSLVKLWRGRLAGVVMCERLPPGATITLTFTQEELGVYFQDREFRVEFERMVREVATKQGRKIIVRREPQDEFDRPCDCVVFRAMPRGR